MPARQFFAVTTDDDGGFMVYDVASSCMSYAHIPSVECAFFLTREEAAAQATRLNLSPTLIAVRGWDTPGRFEAVADTLYGAPW